MSKPYIPVESPEHRGWYEIPGYAGCCANRKGEILTKKTGHITRGGNAGRYLKISAYRDGYDRPSLVYVHDLVCRAFYGPPEPGWVVLHLDDNRWNNQAKNLRWGSQSQNIQSVWDNGLRKRVQLKVGNETHQEPIWFKWS